MLTALVEYLAHDRKRRAGNAAVRLGKRYVLSSILQLRRQASPADFMEVAAYRRWVWISGEMFTNI